MLSYFVLLLHYLSIIAEEGRSVIICHYIICPSLPERTLLSSVSPGMFSEVAEQTTLSPKTPVTVRTGVCWLIGNLVWPYYAQCLIKISNGSEEWFLEKETRVD